MLDSGLGRVCLCLGWVAHCIYFVCPLHSVDLYFDCVSDGHVWFEEFGGFVVPLVEFFRELFWFESMVVFFCHGDELFGGVGGIFMDHDRIEVVAWSRTGRGRVEF